MDNKSSLIRSDNPQTSRTDRELKSSAYIKNWRVKMVKSDDLT